MAPCTGAIQLNSTPLITVTSNHSAVCQFDLRKQEFTLLSY